MAEITVTTALELRTALATSGAVVKLANDINCDDTLAEWEPLTVSADELNLNNHDLLNLVCRSGTALNLSKNFKVHNGRLLNCSMLGACFTSANYGSGGLYQSYRTLFEDIGIGMIINELSTSSGSCFGRGAFFRNAVLQINSTISSSSNHIFYAGSILNYGGLFYDSWLKLTTNNAETSGTNTICGFSGHFENCRVECNVLNGSSAPVSSTATLLGSGGLSTAKGSVIEVKGIPAGTLFTSIASNMSAPNVVTNLVNIQADTKSPPRYQVLSKGNMRSVSAVSSAGFPVIEVS